MSDMIAALKDLVLRGKRNEAAEEVKKALAAGLDPAVIMRDGLRVTGDTGGVSGQLAEA